MYLLREEESPIFGTLRNKEATALIGPRRAGKTTIALQLLENWEKTGGQTKYIDLEALGSPTSAIELQREIEKTPKNTLVALDEIQVIPNWVKVVRGQVELNKRHVIVSGSSAALLSSEIASSLAGRAIPETILPLSYRDARKWKLHNLDEYLKVGGYPECVLRPVDATKLHKLYLELTVLRDVASRLGVREIKPLSDLALLLLSEPGKKISAKVTAQKLGISQPTFRTFTAGLNDAFLILSVPPFLSSPRERIIADAKHYAYDTGLASSVSISNQEDRGRKFENIVAIELIRRGYSISHLASEKTECDFIAQKPGSETIAIQVWAGEGKIPEREYNGLKTGIKIARTTKGLLLTETPSSQVDLAHIPKEIKIETIENWLLQFP